MTTPPTTWAAVLLALAGPFVAVVVIAAAKVREHYYRQKHELAMRQRDERREAYTSFRLACDRLHGGDRSEEARAKFRQKLVGVWVVTSSRPVRGSVHELGNFLLVREPQMEEAGNSSEIDAAYGAILRKFLTAAQRDLGIVPAEPSDALESAVAEPERAEPRSSWWEFWR